MLVSDEFGMVSLVESEAGTLRSADGRLWIGRSRKSASSWLRTFFPIIAAGADAAALFATAIATGYIYHYLFRQQQPALETMISLGAIFAFLVVIANVAKQEYQLVNFLTSKGYASRMFQLWNLIFLGATALGFLTKTSTQFSRVTIVLFYVTGFAALVITRSALAHLVQAGSKRGSVSVRRTFLVGAADELKSFGELYQPWNLGIEIVGVATLGTHKAGLLDSQIETDLQRAVGVARSLAIDDVLILAPWSNHALISLCVENFLKLPASIHLGPEQIFDKFDDVRIAKIGPITSLNLVRRPLSMSERVEKRVLDIILSGLGLILLTPLFIAIAAAIKLDSPGPILFRQRRYGFNQKQFSIYKFRSMRTLDDGSVIRQAQRGDERITPVGYWLRRLSFDELPQLWNVFLGQMSLVGPRPHALAHDREFEQKIALYARRHNVKPGMTGWAQVNGLRGETSTDDKMKDRVEHDLFYIDNWSIWLDFRILVLTVVSRKARSNAY